MRQEHEQVSACIFDFHPDVQAGTWQWPGVKNFPKLAVSGMPDSRLRRKGDLIMWVSISYPSGVAESRAVVPKAALQIDLGLAQPERGIVRSEEQVREYAAGSEGFRPRDCTAARLPLHPLVLRRSSVAGLPSRSADFGKHPFAGNRLELPAWTGLQLGD
jgi:hypothetical protein